MNKDTLAPPIKQKARFKIKDAKCHLRPRIKETNKEPSKQNIQGKELYISNVSAQSVVSLLIFILFYFFLWKEVSFPAQMTVK